MKRKISDPWEQHLRDLRMDNLIYGWLLPVVDGLIAALLIVFAIHWLARVLR